MLGITCIFRRHLCLGVGLRYLFPHISGSLPRALSCLASSSGAGVDGGCLSRLRALCQAVSPCNLRAHGTLTQRGLPLPFAEGRGWGPPLPRALPALGWGCHLHDGGCPVRRKGRPSAPWGDLCVGPPGVPTLPGAVSLPGSVLCPGSASHPFPAGQDSCLASARRLGSGNSAWPSGPASRRGR